MIDYYHIENEETDSKSGQEEKSTRFSTKKNARKNKKKK